MVVVDVVVPTQVQSVEVEEEKKERLTAARQEDGVRRMTMSSAALSRQTEHFYIHG